MEHMSCLLSLRVMDRWQSNTNDPEELFTLTYRAGLRELFEPCHDPLPGRMAELTRTIEQLDQREMI